MAWINRAMLLLFILFIMVETLGLRRTFLWKVQDLDLFVFNRQYLAETFDVPGGLARYLASFFTQFFYHPWLGTLLYLGLLLLISWLTSQAFHLKGYLKPFSHIPALALLLMMTELGYEIHLIKLPGYPFVPLIGMTALLLAFEGYQRFTQPKTQLIFMGFWTLLGFPLFGAYALAGTLLMLLRTVRQTLSEGFKHNWLPLTGGLMLVVGVPYLYYRFVFGLPCLSRFYLSLLPDFVDKETLVLWLPYVLLAGFLLTASLAITPDKHAWKNNHPPLPAIKAQRWAPGILFLATMLTVHYTGFRDEAFDTELAMQEATEQEDWQAVLSLARAYEEEPTRMIVMHTNLALFKLGLAGDQLFKYPSGNSPQHTRGQVLPIQMAGALFYYQYGHLNYAYRWSMEEMVEYGMSHHTLKYAVLTSSLNGESALAKKYNDVLKSTLFHRKWARDREAIINDPGRAMHNPALLNILRLNAFNDVLDGDHSLLETFLLNHAAHSRGGNPELIDLSLLANLQLKQADRFWPRFFVYVNTQPRIPVHYQEAALLFNLQQPQPGIASITFDPLVLKRFNQFVERTKAYNNQPRERIKALMAEEFKGTYWYYYFFADLQLQQPVNHQPYQKL